MVTFDEARKASRWPDHPGVKCECPTCERIWGGGPLFRSCGDILRPTLPPARAAK